jgi:hypothetical protein
MGVFAKGKYALAISDRSGMAFPYLEMVREWNGALVHYSEFESKQPQLNPRPVVGDAQALFNPRVQPPGVDSLILLNPDPFTAVISGGVTFVNVYSLDHQRKAGSKVRFRGPPLVTSTGSGGSDAHNLQAFATIPNFAGVSDINSATGFTITLGQKQADGSVITATGTLSQPENYFFITSSSSATSSGVKGGGAQCSVGPITLKVVNQ